MKKIDAKKNSQVTWVGIDVAKNSYDAAIFLPLEANQKPRDLMELLNHHFNRTLKYIDAFHAWTFQVREKAGTGGGQAKPVRQNDEFRCGCKPSSGTSCSASDRGDK